MAASLAFYTCEDPLQEIDIPADITVSSQSLAIFSSGVSFTATPSADQNSVSVEFIATDSWWTEIEDTKSSSWLSVKPESGKAGEVTMTVTVLPNDTEEARVASVTIVCGSKKVSFRVTQEGLPPVIKVESITLDQSSLTLVEGDTAELVATVLPEDAQDKTVTWRSSDQAVATVEDGVVTAVKEGAAVITASAGEKTATCEVTVTKKYVPVTGISLDVTDVAMIKGDAKVLIATVTPDDATEPEITWLSSNPQAVTVEQLMTSTQMAQMTAVGGGSAVITAKAGDKTATCSVSVTVPVESITLDRVSIALEEGQSTTLAATVLPSDATDKTVTWSSSNPAVASVNNGLVKALSEGIATITATAGDKTATCSISVEKLVIPVESITLDYTERTIDKGYSWQLHATVYPNNATDQTVTWSSSDSKVATVDASGLVTAVGAGTTMVFAKAGEQTATCNITVTVPVTSLSFSDDNNSSIRVGESTVWQVIIEPEDATDKTVTWSVFSNPEVASVDQNGKITGLSEGQARIKAAVGSFWTISSVYVSSAIVPVESVSLDRVSVTLEEGQSTTLTATILPSNATDKTVTWGSSNTSVATVNNGVVIALAEGSATITASAGGKTASCSVYVQKRYVPVSYIWIDYSNIALRKGESITIRAIAYPTDATDTAITWSSSDEAVVLVDNSGVVHAVGGGSAMVTATAGGQSASCSITVIVPITGLSLDRDTITLSEGESTTLIATVSPTDATDYTIVWESSNPDYASVDQNGKVTAIQHGYATITAKIGLYYRAYCSVIIQEKGIGEDDPEGFTDGGSEEW